MNKLDVYFNDWLLKTQKSKYMISKLILKDRFKRWKLFVTKSQKINQFSYYWKMKRFFNKLVRNVLKTHHNSHLLVKSIQFWSFNKYKKSFEKLRIETKKLKLMKTFHFEPITFEDKNQTRHRQREEYQQDNDDQIFRLDERREEEDIFIDRFLSSTGEQRWIEKHDQTFSRKSPILLSTNSSLLFEENEMIDSNDDEKQTYYDNKRGKTRNGNLDDDNFIFHSFKSQKKNQNLRNQINQHSSFINSSSSFNNNTPNQSPPHKRTKRKNNEMMLTIIKKSIFVLENSSQFSFQERKQAFSNLQKLERKKK